jgi:uncharacterized protein (DUF2141 family)/uncharacterized membrane protein
MFGIRGLDSFGAIHAGFGLASLLLGLAVVVMQKGTPWHRRVGLLYAAAMLLLNGTALAIYDLFGGFGPFHVLALVSLATLAAGVVPVWLRRPREWLDIHARCMSWSYAGLVAAFFAEIGARLPSVGLVTGVLVPTMAVMLAAAVFIHVRVPRVVARLALLLCVGLPAHAAQDEKPQPAGTITVRLTGFKDATGAARVALATSSQFLADGALRAASVAIKDGRAVAVFERVPYGSYAVQAYQDRNGNGTLDRNFLGIPSEPYGFSNGARRATGPPRYADAAFTLAVPALTVDVAVR